MQKASTSFEKAKEAEKEYKRETSWIQKRADKVEKEGVGYAQQLKEAMEEADRLRNELANQKRQSLDAEQILRQELAATDARVEAEYDRAVIEITSNYRAQMPAVKDVVWEMSWKWDCAKMGLPVDSPMCINMELPSQMGALAT